MKGFGRIISKFAVPVVLYRRTGVRCRCTAGDGRADAACTLCFGAGWALEERQTRACVRYGSTVVLRGANPLRPAPYGPEAPSSWVAYFLPEDRPGVGDFVRFAPGRGLSELYVVGMVEPKFFVGGRPVYYHCWLEPWRAAGERS